MRYRFIAVNYNGFQYTKDFIESINSLDKKNEDLIEIIIVDNASNQEQILKLEEYVSNLKNVNLVKSTKNLGYFGGLNLGLSKISDKSNEVIIIGNNDLTFDINFLTEHKKIVIDSDIFLIAPNVITKEGRQQNPLLVNEETKINRLKNKIYFSNYYVGQALKILNHFMKRLRNKPQKLTHNLPQMRIKRGIGAIYILTKNFTKHFDKLDDRVFMWGEEAMLTNQIESKKGTTLYCPNLIVYHHESASVSAIQNKKKYYMVRESYKIYKNFL